MTLTLTLSLTLTLTLTLSLTLTLTLNLTLTLTLTLALALAQACGWLRAHRPRLARQGAKGRVGVQPLLCRTRAVHPAAARGEG